MGNHWCLPARTNYGKRVTFPMCSPSCVQETEYCNGTCFTLFTYNRRMVEGKPTWHGLVNFIGYTEQGLPVYVYWYKHAYIGDEQDPDYSFYPSGAPGI